MSDDFRLLICGSRKVNKAMLDYTFRAVERVKELGWGIVVGDAFGIDHAVLEACHKLSVPFDCFGITDQPRHVSYMWKRGYLYHHLEMNYRRVQGDYLARDREMAVWCNRVLAIWNGTSRGTKYTYDFVRNLGKPGDLVKFKV